MSTQTKAQLQASLRQLGLTFSQADSAAVLQAILDNAKNNMQQQQQQQNQQQNQQKPEYSNPLSGALSQVEVSEHTKLSLLNLNTQTLFAWDNDSFVKLPLSELTKAISGSGIQFDLDVKSLSKLLANIAKDGVLLQPIQVSYDSTGKLIIVSGRNRTAVLLLVELLKQTENPTFRLTVPVQMLNYPNDNLLYKAVIAANDSRRMGSTEQSLTEVSAVLPSVTLDSVYGAIDSLSDKQLKSALATLVRSKLAEKHGNSINEFDYSLGLKSAKDSKFLLELLTAVLPSTSALKSGKGKKSTVQYARLERIVEVLTSTSSLETTDKAVSQTLAKCPSDTLETIKGYARPIQAVLLLKASGVDRLARSITKAEEGSYSLKSILLSLCNDWKTLSAYNDTDSAPKPTAAAIDIDIKEMLSQLEVDCTDL